MPITAGVRPGLKPRAESPSPLKGAVRRPGARVDRLGAGAVGVSRLQPAWGVSPAVHGRAIEDTAARLICDTCRARRVGHAESPRPRRGGRGSASPLHRWVGTSPVRPIPATVGPYRPSCRGQAPPDPPAREGRQSPRDTLTTVVHARWRPPRRHADSGRTPGATGVAAPTPTGTCRRCTAPPRSAAHPARPARTRSASACHSSATRVARIRSSTRGSSTRTVSSRVSSRSLALAARSSRTPPTRSSVQ